MKQPLAICALVKNESVYLEEWIAFHLLMGVSRFRIYDNDSTDETALVLSDLSSKRFPVEVIRWIDDRPHWPAVQRNAYLDGARNLARHASFVAFIDIDEFLFSIDGRLLPEYLSSMSAKTGAVAVNQRIFGSSGHTRYEADLVIARFSKRAHDSYEEHAWFKSIARPELVMDFDSSHSIILESGDYVMTDGSPLARGGSHPGMADRVSKGPIVLNHYIVKSLEEFEGKRSRWTNRTLRWRYADKNSYFHKRDAVANLEDDGHLLALAPAVRQYVSNMRSTNEVYRTAGEAGDSLLSTKA
jgi:Glycosyltransferase family 92